MSIDREFGDHLVVTSSTTRVDTERLVAAALTVRDQAARAAEARAQILRAIEFSAPRAVLAPAETTWAHQILWTASAQTTALAASLHSLADALAFAALVYAAAEADAAAFEDIWQVLRPDSASGWTTGWGTVHTRQRLREALPDALEEAVPGQVLDLMGAPILPLAAGAVRSALWHVDAFDQGLNSDGTDMLRLQFDLQALAALVADNTWGGGHGTGTVVDQDLVSWWGLVNSRVPAAASFAASWAFGIGRLMNGPTTGVQVSAAVPHDTLDVRTGRPVAWRAASEVTASDTRAPASGVSWVPGDFGVLQAASAVGSIAGALPVRQSTGVPGTAVAAARPPHRTPTPLRPSALLERIGELRSSPRHGQLEILRHETPRPDGGTRRSWSVVIRGTQDWKAGGQNPQDMLTNLQGVAGERSDQGRAVVAAMERAGIQPGDPVELTGHSQGGILAAQLAADPEVASRYSVVSVLTAGSPTAASVPEGQARLLALENTRDPVPALDGSANRDFRGSATVTFDSGFIHSERGEASGTGPHDLAYYMEAMNWIEDRPGRAALADATDWVAARQRALGLGPDTATTSLIFDTRRVHGHP